LARFTSLSSLPHQPSMLNGCRIWKFTTALSAIAGPQNRNNR
jgi:hypothetical protein